VAIVAAAVIYRVKVRNIYRQTEEDRAEAVRLRESAEQKLEAERRELQLAAKEDAIKLRDRIEAELKSQREEVDEAKRRLEKREDRIAQAGAELDQRGSKLREQETELEKLREELQDTLEEQEAEVQRISGMTQAEARQILLSSVEEEIQQDANAMVRQAAPWIIPPRPPSRWWPCPATI
jgi:ribonuclease Y